MTGHGATHSPTLPIQEALFERIRDDDVISELGYEVFDYVPEDKERERKYVTVGEMFTTPDNTGGSIGWITIATLTVWSKERGFRIPHAVKDRLIELFDHQPMTVDGFHHVETRHEFDQLLYDPQPTLRRALLRLRISTEQL